jgi:L-fuconolactonase
LIVDTHTHVACGTDDRFPTTPTEVAGEWWRSGGTIEELLVELDTNEVDRAVVVQAIGAYGHDCRCAAAAVHANESRCAFIASVDMTIDDPAAAVSILLDDPPSGVRVAGVRLFGVGGHDTSWLTDGRGAAVWDLASETGIVLVPTIFADRFAELRVLAAIRPDVRVAIDHCGFVDKVVEPDAELSLIALADTPSVHLKVTSYVLEAAERDDGDAAPLVERLVAAFGSDRLCWGSDHPQDQRQSYAGKIALARRATRSFTAAQTESFFAMTGTDLFF